MTYDQALKYVHTINSMFCNPGLSRIIELCQALGNPQDKTKYIHVAGTNGKGSFSVMTASALSHAGYKTGLYVSPHLRKINERMSIDGQDISDGEFSALTEEVKQYADKMQDKPTEFELLTAIGFLYFARNNCDVVVLECGLGGRLDATNLINTQILSVITGIALDHTKILGDTTEKIAGEKAGIIKPNAPALWCGYDKSADSVIANAAKDAGVELYTPDRQACEVLSATLDGTVFSYKNFKNIKIPLLGSYQPINATNVLEAVWILRKNGLNIPDSAVYEGLASVVWHARFEIISKNPLIIDDGGHNPEGVSAAVAGVRQYFGNRKIYIVTGVMADKDYHKMAADIASVASRVFCLTPDNTRALNSVKYAEVYRESGLEADGYDSVFDALSAAISLAKKTNTPILCLGSLYMYDEVLTAVEVLTK